MKKIVGIIAAAALATSAFAEINIGSWNRAVFEPIHYDGDTLRSFNGASWGVGDKGGSRTSVSFSASTENAGFVIDLHSNPAIGVGDNSYVWVKPINMLTVKFGKIDNANGRLDHCFGAWDASRFNTMEGEGLAGVDRSWRGGQAANIVLEPVEGLIIDYQANFEASVNDTRVSDSHAYDILWESSSTMIGYKADFGFIRAIINGKQATTYKAGEDTKPAALIGLAADITAVENLTLKFGLSVPTDLTHFDYTAGEAAHTEYELDKYTATGVTTKISKYVEATEAKVSGNAIKAAVAADYNLDALAFHGHVEADVMPNKVEDGEAKLGAFGVKVGAGVDYAFSDAWKLITDFRFQSWTATKLDGSDVKYEDPAWGAYLGLRQQLSNASFEFGGMFGTRSLKNTAASELDKFTFAVPLTITASF